MPKWSREEPSYAMAFRPVWHRSFLFCYLAKKQFKKEPIYFHSEIYEHILKIWINLLMIKLAKCYNEFKKKNMSIQIRNTEVNISWLLESEE